MFKKQLIIFILIYVVASSSLFAINWLFYQAGIHKGQTIIQWIDKPKATIRYDDKYCYVFTKQIYDKPIDIMICREK